MGFVEFTPKGSHAINFSFGQSYVEDNVPYIMHESWLGTVPGNISLLNDSFRNYTIDQDADNKNILIIRTLGAGDMLILSSVVQVIKNKYPNAKISFACVPVQKEIPQIIEHVDEIYDIPLKSEIFHKFDFHFEVSGLIEGKDENKNRNIYDVYLEKLGVPVIDGVADIDNNFKRPFIRKDIYENVSKSEKTIGIHPFANDPIRQLDPNVVNIISSQLINMGYEVILFCSAQEKQHYKPFFNPKITFSKGESYTASVTEVAKCDTLIGCDSLMTHLAQAVGTKTIAIYGPFSSYSRAHYYKNIKIVDTNPDCRCFKHNLGQCPKHFRISPCLNIDPEFIIDIVINNTTPEVEYKGEINVQATKYNWR